MRKNNFKCFSMKWCCILFLVCSGMNLTAQTNIRTQKVTLGFNKKPLSEALLALEKVSDFRMVFSNESVEKVNPIDLPLAERTVEATLDLLLQGSNLSYSTQGNTIVLAVKADVQQTSSTPQQVAQERRVTGTVISDATGVTLPFVTVRIKGTTVGTVTSIDGVFTINVPSTESVLQFSFMGYEDLELQANVIGPMAVRLMQSTATLEGVVITGMFNRRAESFTGAAISFQREELLRAGTQNVFQSLRNLDPALDIMDNNILGSDPNAVPDMTIRGSSSLIDVRNEYGSNPNLPLFILDGFEVDARFVMDMDMNRIESITLLKDAAAKAIYGAKAANGVIVIETVRLTPGQLRINYTSTFSVSMPDNSSYNMCNAEEKLALEKLLGLYEGNQPAVSIRLKELYMHNLSEVARGVNTDWMAQPLRNAFSNRHFINAEAGDDKIRIGLDLGYNNVQGVMKGSSREIINGAVNVVYRHNNLLFRNTVELMNTDAYDSPWGDFQQYADLNPYWRMRDENGELLSLLGVGPVFSAPVYNPMLDAQTTTRRYSGFFNVTNRSNLEYTLNNKLRIIGRFSLSREDFTRETFFPASHSRFRDIQPGSDGYFRRGTFDAGYGKRIDLGGDINLNYNDSWGRHAIFTNARFDIRQNRMEYYQYSAEGFPSDRMDDIIFARQYTLNGSPTGSEDINREIGMLGVINYTFDDRYFADLSFRRSASSQFGANDRWGSFWATGIGWNLHNETFMRGNPIINQLRLRGSVGYTGSQSFNSFQALWLYRYYMEHTYQGGMGVYLEALANPNLKWQRKMDYNIGMDVSLFRALTMRVDLYNSITSDLISDIVTPPSMGFGTYKANFGEIRNRGVEVAMNYRIFSNPRERISASVFINGAHNRNTINKISNALEALNNEMAEEAQQQRSNRPIVRFEEGQSLTAIWAVRSKGIDPATGREIFIKKDGSLTDVWDAADQAVVGDTEAKLRGNFGFNFEYKGWTASMNFRYRIGGQIYNQTLVNKVENARMNGNVDRRAFYDTWQKPGDVVMFRDVGAWNDLTQATSRFVQDINTLDMGMISVGYDFYRFDFVKRMGMSRLQVRFNMNDAVNWSTVRIERGTSYPFARMVSGTVIVNF